MRARTRPIRSATDAASGFDLDELNELREDG
jgi:hypothetical protein